MSIKTFQREISDLKERQIKLEAWLRATFGYDTSDREYTMRPVYIRKIKRISERMKRGRGITEVKTKEELRRFFKEL